MSGKLSETWLTVIGIIICILAIAAIAIYLALT
jgi:hypothetical protein